MQLIHGDCLEAMRRMEENSVDAVVTDPPYGLSFMGRKWDYDVPGIEIWQEVLRVLKPGGYLLAFAGTRTQHRMACRIEDAGFEIRDMIAWVYGSGFPKSLNIGKAVDELRGSDRTAVGQSRGHTGGVVESHKGVHDDDNYEWPGAFEVTRGTSEWEGWGTALKPAVETITVARKPLSENTVATNCLKWGTGGINIDGCRVDHNDPLKETNRGTRGSSVIFSNQSCGIKDENRHIASASPKGRFPANLIHDGSAEVLAGFPETKSGKMNEGQPRSSKPLFGTQNDQIHETFGDSGSAARFFYCAKASASERNDGVEDGNKHPTVKPVALMEYLVKLVSREGAVVLDPFAGSGTTGIACVNLGREFIGIEREQAYFDVMKARIEKAQEQGKLL